MELTPAQSVIISDEHRFRTLVCGRKFGKTTTASEEIAACAFSKNERRVIYIAPTLDDARRLMWERLKKIFKNCTEKNNETRLELLVPTQDGGTSNIFLGSWEKVENYRGDEFDLAVFDEVQDYREFWLGWRNAMRPTLTPRRGSALFMGTPKGFNHLYDLFMMDKEEEAFKSFHFTTYDNPYIPKEEIEEAKRQLTEDSFAQEYLADFRKMEGLVYKEFDRRKHVVNEEWEVFDKRFAGVDFGTTNPCGIPTILKDKDGRYLVSDEIYERGLTDAAIADRVAAEGFNEVYPDPESPGGIKELKDKGVNVRDVKKGKDSVKNGINVVRELFKANRLFIHARCKNLIWELETYAYPDKRPLHNEEENPIKENDHLLDALRYALVMEMPASRIPMMSVYRPKRAGFARR